MGVLSWVIFGALAGWVASMIAGTNGRQGCLTDIIVGIAGAFIGGFIYSIATGRDLYFQFDITSFIVAVIGALVLLFGLKALTGRRRA